MTETELRETYGNHAVDALSAMLASGTSPQIDDAGLTTTIHATSDWVNVGELLADAAKLGWVERIDTRQCSNCGQSLDNFEGDECPFCGVSLDDHPSLPVRLFRSLKPLNRNIPWLIAIHGFNTTGRWQELFSWLIATNYRHRAPVLIYKYGLVRFGVLFRRRNLYLARDLGKRIRTAVSQAARSGIDEPPDIVIHSFGSQLFRLVLETPEFDDLKFGRVIAVGSVIRPDFGWSQHIAAGRIDAVLNQCGTRDLAVPWAQFAIPDTGPAARHGFTDPQVVNITAPYGHSGAFDEEQLLKNLGAGGAWDAFLRAPAGNYQAPNRMTPRHWEPCSRAVRFLTRIALIIMLIAAGLWLLVRHVEWLLRVMN